MTQSDTPPQGATLLLCPVHPGVHSEKLANPPVTWKGENDEPEHPRERVRAQIFYFDRLVEGQTIFATSRNVVHLYTAAAFRKSFAKTHTQKNWHTGRIIPYRKTTRLNPFRNELAHKFSVSIN